MRAFKYNPFDKTLFNFTLTCCTNDAAGWRVFSQRRAVLHRLFFSIWHPQDENKQLPSSVPKKQSKPKLSTGKDRSVDSAVDKQRQEARKRLLAAKRAASVRQNSATESADSIEIYVPEAQTRLWERTSTDQRGTILIHFRHSWTRTRRQIWHKHHHVQRMHRSPSLIAAQLMTGDTRGWQGTQTTQNNADHHLSAMGLK